jgi:hypothetical protein
LLHGAAARTLARPPTQEFCAVAQTAAGEVIEVHFNHKPGRLDQGLQFFDAARSGVNARQ